MMQARALEKRMQMSAEADDDEAQHIDDIASPSSDSSDSSDTSDSNADDTDDTVYKD